nr:unnamed protein product [Callosobruchus analis]
MVYSVPHVFRYTHNEEQKHALEGRDIIQKARRVTYVAPKETINIPEYIKITHEFLKYRVFLSLDSQTCFKCKQEGHIAAQCPTTIQQSTTPPNENSSTPSPPTEETNMQYNETTEPSQKQETKDTTQTNTRSDIDINNLVSTAKSGFSEALTPENESTTDSTTRPIFVSLQITVIPYRMISKVIHLYPFRSKYIGSVVVDRIHNAAGKVLSSSILHLLQRLHQYSTLDSKLANVQRNERWQRSGRCIRIDLATITATDNLVEIMTDKIEKPELELRASKESGFAFISFDKRLDYVSLECFVPQNDDGLQQSVINID